MWKAAVGGRPNMAATIFNRLFIVFSFRLIISPNARNR